MGLVWRIKLWESIWNLNIPADISSEAKGVVSYHSTTFNPFNLQGAVLSTYRYSFIKIRDFCQIPLFLIPVPHFS